MPDEVNKKFEAKHLANIKANQKQIKKHYLSVIEKIYKKAQGLQFNGKEFKLENYPALSSEIDRALLKFSKDFDITLFNGIKAEWELSIEKNFEIVHKNYGKENISDSVNKILLDPQSAALEEFINRKINGLGISDRVWKYTNQFKNEIENNLYAGLSEGKSAAAMARDHVQYLENPDKLFRRVKYINSKGDTVLRLSKAAQEYKPGKGVYRSSYKNAMRLTRDTINDSYRQADMVKYQSLAFVLGYVVNLSAMHPVTDICDALKGIYPKTFVWRKWHNQCICNCTPKLPSMKEYREYERAILNGTDSEFVFTGQVNDMPKNLNTYVEENKGFMDNWKRKPDWVTENGINL
ncbi:hypothetical protein [Pedobacter metabolipauper]|uniref:Uncharacterized protein n=1 Tax=Pedobacter metabolipauper TaxID=425513 RepID=A0A4R6T465_9SPHI|nr:hypothetical protein [Pedobacter metabolipauper]TDQ12171.1 hypothetical protein ATK78_1303 [Pedobacter metabolipauper]